MGKHFIIQIIFPLKKSDIRKLGCLNRLFYIFKTYKHIHYLHTTYVSRQSGQSSLLQLKGISENDLRVERTYMQQCLLGNVCFPLNCKVLHNLLIMLSMHFANNGRSGQM